MVAHAEISKNCKLKSPFSPFSLSLVEKEPARQTSSAAVMFFVLSPKIGLNTG